MKKFAIIIGILLLVLLGVAIYISLNKEIISTEPVVEINKEEKDVEVDESNLKSLVVKHQYKDGQHIFMGDIETPTFCYDLEVNVEDTTDPNIKNIVINSINNQPGNDCEAVVSKKTFKVDYPGEQNLVFKMTLNGEKVRLNIFDLAPDVNIDEFELFIKG